MRNERERQNKIRQFLLKKERASWHDIFENTKIPSKQLAADIKKLMDMSQIEARKDKHDRRVTWYEPCKERVETEVQRYKATEFLADLKEPLSHEITVPKGKYQTYLSVFVQARGLEPEKERKALELMLMQAKKSIDNTTISFWQPGNFDKVVLFFAVEEKQRENEE